jgi:solute carrier family 29 (equilibrative nucleoside transporter), member 1/2/3
MFLFSLSNGYVSTLVMLAAVVEPTLEELEVDIAATCMAFYLTS